MNYIVWDWDKSIINKIEEKADNDSLDQQNRIIHDEPSNRDSHISERKLQSEDQLITSEQQKEENLDVPSNEKEMKTMENDQKEAEQQDGPQKYENDGKDNLNTIDSPTQEEPIKEEKSEINSIQPEPVPEEVSGNDELKKDHSISIITKNYLDQKYTEIEKNIEL